ncbi:hypothetical protein GGQ74_002842 [Desulfobaculum xiamenense]|uniref:DUF4125 family protein n=1 Tax=Desulfobaculum xiamenense TaxID=995050 RepID=A0A846QUF6_9BACT|nr:DUF4125 family protein [Desulfobaculum xiamenense]NJB69145.1 hypothetical protein [Desulfobaculum xiamenense]
MTEERREALVEDIIERELRMFLAVKTRGGKSLCQERPESFRIMREMTHGVLSEAVLESYLGDLVRAEEAGRNFMTEKYALMDDLIPAINTDPRIRVIVEAEADWRDEVSAQFPRTVQRDGRESFCLYLRCELQTYSPATLTAYAALVDAARNEGRNLVRERYEILMRKLGYGSLEACEAQLAAH